MLKDGLSESYGYTILYIYTFIYKDMYVVVNLRYAPQTPDFGLSVDIPICGNRKYQGQLKKMAR